MSLVDILSVVSGDHCEVIVEEVDGDISLDENDGELSEIVVGVVVIESVDIQILSVYFESSVEVGLVSVAVTSSPSVENEVPIISEIDPNGAVDDSEFVISMF